MKIGLAVYEFADLVALTGAMTKGDTHTHPILGFVVFDLRRRQAPPLALAASHLGVARIEMPAMTPEEPGTDDPLLFAVPHDHLAKLAKLTPARGQVWIETVPGAVTVELASSSLASLGRWTLPTAAKRDLDAFPDEPTDLAAAEPTVWAADDLARALAICQPNPVSHLQVSGSLLLESTWQRATCATSHPYSTGPDDIILPAAAASVLTKLAETADGNVTVTPGETWTHVEAGHVRLYLAKLANAVDDYRRLFFGETMAYPDGNITVGSGALTTAVRRASALFDQVEITVKRDQLTVAATDGSSSHRVTIDAPDITVPPARFNADVFLSSLAKLEPGTIVLSMPNEGHPYAYLADAETTVALVPLLSPA